MGELTTVTRAYMQNIADAIRQKSGDQSEDKEYENSILNLNATSNDYTDSNGYRYIIDASSVYQTAINRQAYNAFNTTYGDSVTGDVAWHPASGVPQWLSIQFEKSVMIKSFVVKNRTGDIEHPTAFTLQGSDDGETWEDIQFYTWSATGNGLTLNCEVDDPQSFIYYRLYCTAVTSSPYAVIAQWRFTNVYVTGSGEKQTYYPSQMAQAILSIPTGGGHDTVPLFSQEDWDALTETQKKTYALVAIQQADTGYSRGILVNGADYEPYTWSDYLTTYIDLGVNINASYTVECLFYANGYQNDGHIIGNMTRSLGDGFHLTTYSNRWYASNGSGEVNFAADGENYPLYGKEIVYRLEPDGKVYLNGTYVTTSTMGTLGTRYALNTRGGSISTSGLYKYNYFKIWDENDILIHDFRFLMDGTLVDIVN